MPNPENFDHTEELKLEKELGSQDFGLSKEQTKNLINRYAGGLEI
jgi:hypothetical protein